MTLFPCLLKSDFHVHMQYCSNILQPRCDLNGKVFINSENVLLQHCLK